MKAMIFAAGRGKRMRPLTDTCPKPLLRAGKKALIEWQIEALVRAGFTNIVINHAWLGEQLESCLGNGQRFGAHIQYSPEQKALETAGGIRQALPLLCSEKHSNPVFLAVSGDIFTDYDYRQLTPHAERLSQASDPGMHLVMVPNPPFHPTGDFSLEEDGTLSLEGTHRLTFGNIGLYDIRLFESLPSGSCMPMTPYYHATIAKKQATGEYFSGTWENIGTPEQLAALNKQLQQPLT